jgi:hypothetical protein
MVTGFRTARGFRNYMPTWAAQRVGTFAARAGIVYIAWQPRMKTLQTLKLIFRPAVPALALGLGGLGFAAPSMTAVSRADLCVTEGAIGQLSGTRLSVDAAKMRAYLNTPTQQSVDAHFTYMGPTANEVRLGSGELRRQFGLKLRAQDACNLVYVMWRIQPASKVVVSVKSNPLQHSSSQCGNRGYRNIKPRHASEVGDLLPGVPRTLRAEMRDAELRVFVDNSLVWEGSLGSAVQGLEGPVGVRSDNARLVIELRAGEPLGATAQHPPACRANSEDAE